MKYRVVVSTSAEKFVICLPLHDYLELRKAIGSLSDEPWGVQSKKVVGNDLWRLRVRRYRIIYFVNDKQKVVYIERIARRSEGTCKGL